MSDDDNQLSEKDRSHQALAGSAPDESTTLMKMIRLLRDIPNFRILTIPLIGMIIGIYTVAKFGVPAILALQTLILQLHSPASEQTVQEQIEEKQREDAVVHGIEQIGGKLDAQGDQLGRIGDDVELLKARQAATDQRLSNVASEQRRQAKMLQKPPD